ncbi:MAG: polyhydroxyalkanoate synthesis regulator DNA-binding domain-containing protein [Bacteroidota bacterium]
MTRLIKRYGSRKLYDTAESRYIALDEIARLIRDGEEIRVEDSKTGEDVTATVLTQLIAEESRRDGATLPQGFLHDVIRMGERLGENALRVGENAMRAGEQAVRASSESVRQVQQQVEGFMKTSLDRIAPTRVSPVTDIRDEMERLRARLEALEQSLDHLDADAAEGTPPASPDASASSASAPGSSASS